MSAAAKVFIGCIAAILGMIWLVPFVPPHVEGAVHGTGFLATMGAIVSLIKWAMDNDLDIL